MTQISFASCGFDAHSKVTRKAAFLERMDKLVPWNTLECLIEPHYPKTGNGCPPEAYPPCCACTALLTWFKLADEACEDAMYDIAAFSAFCQIDFGRQAYRMRRSC